LPPFVSRDEWVAQLLDGVETKQFSAADFDARCRAQLAALKNDGLHRRAEKLLAVATGSDAGKWSKPTSSVPASAGGRRAGQSAIRQALHAMPSIRRHRQCRRAGDRFDQRPLGPRPCSSPFLGSEPGRRGPLLDYAVRCRTGACSPGSSPRNHPPA